MAEEKQMEDVFTSGEADQDGKKEEEATQDDLGEASLDGDMNTTQEDSATSHGMNLDGANDMDMSAPDQDEPTLETRLPAKKDVALREFLSKMDDYAPIVRLLHSPLISISSLPRAALISHDRFPMQSQTTISLLPVCHLHHRLHRI